MSIVILYLWVTTASSRLDTHASWIPGGEYSSMQTCEAAIAKLGIKNTGRCIDTGIK